VKITTLLALVAGELVIAGSVSASPPVAVVEAVTGNSAGVEFMDYVEPGRVIRLEPGDSIVLSYMKSCIRETMNGGTLIVGIERSEVQFGKVDRTTVKCDAGGMLLTAQQASQSAGMLFRTTPVPPGEPDSPSEAQFILYGLSPIVEVKGGGTLVIERINQPGERHEVTVDKTPHGAFYDFASVGRTLTAGATYRATSGAQQMVFKVDPDAKPGRAPIVGRLLRFEHPS
jgi:hypothetical protein